MKHNRPSLSTKLEVAINLHSVDSRKLELCICWHSFSPFIFLTSSLADFLCLHFHAGALLRPSEGEVARPLLANIAWPKLDARSMWQWNGKAHNTLKLYAHVYGVPVWEIIEFQCVTDMHTYTYWNSSRDSCVIQSHALRRSAIIYCGRTSFPASVGLAPNIITSDMHGLKPELTQRRNYWYII